MVENGEAENQFIECKSPDMPKFSRDLQQQIAEAISGFANTNGGIIIVGMGTINKFHSGLDILTQIEEIANINVFSKQVSVKIPTLTTPSANTIKYKIIKKSKKNTRGVLLIYIPQTQGEPYQSNVDNYFYFRTGDEFKIAPYDMIKRLFASTDRPDMHTRLSNSDINFTKEGYYEIETIINNKSYAIAEQIYLMLEVFFGENIESLTPVRLKDISKENPGRKLFSLDVSRVIHKGTNWKVGTLRVKMKPRKKKLKIKFIISASKMVPREEAYILYLNRKNIKIESSPTEYL